MPDGGKTEIPAGGAVRRSLEESSPVVVSRETVSINFHGFSLTLSPFTLRAEGVALPLSLREYRLLRTFFRHPDTPISRQALFRVMGGSPEKASVRVVDACVSRLRKKLAACLSANTAAPLAGKGFPLRQIRGVGYGLWRAV